MFNDDPHETSNSISLSLALQQDLCMVYKCGGSIGKMQHASQTTYVTYWSV